MQTQTETSNFSIVCCWLVTPLHPPPTRKGTWKCLGGLGWPFWLFPVCWSTWRTLTKFLLKIKLPSWLLCEFNKFASGYVGERLCARVCVFVCVLECVFVWDRQSEFENSSSNNRNKTGWRAASGKSLPRSCNMKTTERNPKATFPIRDVSRILSRGLTNFNVCYLITILIPVGFL